MISYRQADLLRHFVDKRDSGMVDDLRPQFELILINTGDGIIRADIGNQSTHTNNAHTNNALNMVRQVIRDNGFYLGAFANYVYLVQSDEQDNGPLETRHIEFLVEEGVKPSLEYLGFEVWEKSKDNIANTGGRYILWCTYIK